jgi:hypothetical protein
MSRLTKLGIFGLTVLEVGETNEEGETLAILGDGSEGEGTAAETGEGFVDRGG